MPLVASFPLPFFVLTWSSWFSAVVIKRHGQKQLREESVYLGLWFQREPVWQKHGSAQAQWQEQEAEGGNLIWHEATEATCS